MKDEKMNNNHQQIESVTDYLKSVEGWVNESQTLFRGQDCDGPLIPIIARKESTNDTTDLEIKMLEEFKRRTAQDSTLSGLDDWDLLVHAQHYGMATRLLDWTTNPLVALWFACIDLNDTKSSYIYVLLVDDDILLNKSKNTNPFNINKTQIFKPKINNPRIAAQGGWFTVHSYSKKYSKFVDLHKNKDLKFKVLMKAINPMKKKNIIDTLDKLGVNNETLFPGLEGTCRYLNYAHKLS